MKVKFEKREGLLKRIMKGLFNKKLLKNKIYSIGLMLIGYITLLLSGGNATGFMFTLLIGLPLFFAKENYID